MSDKPHDPAQGSIDQDKRHESSLQGQQGPGVDYEDQRFSGTDAQELPPEGRSGSYETGNVGGYGNTTEGPQGQVAAPDRPVTLPDPEAQQGQGGE